jgi:hypothetical protein
MRNVVSLSEIVGQVESPGGSQGVCATAEGTYDEHSSELTVKLDCFVRPFLTARQNNEIRAEWLPGSEAVTESVSSTEALQVAKEIFANWVPRVRRSIPEAARFRELA